MAGNSNATAMMKEAAALMDDAGLVVKASSGWESRGRSSDVNYWAVIAHHTASTSDNDSLLINGRSDLPGPLCNWALHANGDWVLIASGRANHAGEGTVSNSESQGIEATGPWGYPDTYGPAAFKQYDEYEIGCAALLAAMDADISDLFGHKETARPVGRKIDPYFDMPSFRTGVESGEDELPYSEQELTNFAKSGAKSALNDWDSARPARLTEDESVKPYTITEIQGVWGSGMVGLDRKVSDLQKQVSEILAILKPPAR
jgi:hypothetical protein